MFVDAASCLVLSRTSNGTKGDRTTTQGSGLRCHTKIAVDHDAYIACSISSRRKRLLLVILLLLKGVAELEGVVVLGGGNNTKGGVNTTTRRKDMCQRTG